MMIKECMCRMGGRIGGLLSVYMIGGYCEDWLMMKVVVVIGDCCYNLMYSCVN